MAAPARAPCVFDPSAYDRDSVPSEDVKEGVTRKVITGENAMLVLYQIKDGTVFARHNHPHEQFTEVGTPI